MILACSSFETHCQIFRMRLRSMLSGRSMVQNIKMKLLLLAAILIRGFSPGAHDDGTGLRSVNRSATHFQGDGLQAEAYHSCGDVYEWKWIARQTEYAAQAAQEEEKSYCRCWIGPGAAFHRVVLRWAEPMLLRLKSGAGKICWALRINGFWAGRRSRYQSAGATGHNADRASAWFSALFQLSPHTGRHILIQSWQARVGTGCGINGCPDLFNWYARTGIITFGLQRFMIVTKTDNRMEQARRNVRKEAMWSINQTDFRYDGRTRILELRGGNYSNYLGVIGVLCYLFCSDYISTLSDKFCLLKDRSSYRDPDVEP